MYTVTDIHTKPGENVTYADLDTRYVSTNQKAAFNLLTNHRYFMVPENKVLPTQQGSKQDSRSTYAEISSKPMYV